VNERARIGYEPPVKTVSAERESLSPSIRRRRAAAAARGAGACCCSSRAGLTLALLLVFLAPGLAIVLLVLLGATVALALSVSIGWIRRRRRPRTVAPSLRPGTTASRLADLAREGSTLTVTGGPARDGGYNELTAGTLSPSARATESTLSRQGSQGQTVAHNTTVCGGEMSEANGRCRGVQNSADERPLGGLGS